jgi:hypothetical protein
VQEAHSVAEVFFEIGFFQIEGLVENIMSVSTFDKPLVVGFGLKIFYPSGKQWGQNERASSFALVGL